MAVYLPSARIAVDVVDDPTSLPVDLDAFPDYTVVSVTRADLNNPAARSRMVKRIARAAGAARGKDGAGAASGSDRKRLLELIDTGLELSHGRAGGRPGI